MKRLGILLLALIGLYLLLHEWAPLRRYGVARDEVILGVIAVLYLAIAAVMLWRTTDWGARSLGLLCTMLGDAALYGDAAWSALDKEHHLPGHPPPATMTGDVVRSLFIAGGVLLFVGLALYVWGEEAP